jgi:iron complex transport system substrate-binding protein
VSLAPNLTEVLYRLGLEDRIVGVTTYCDYPPAALLKPKMGDFSNPSLEALIQARPDMVLMSWNEQAHLLPKLESLGLDVAVFYPGSVEELMSVIRNLASVFGREAAAQGLLDSLGMVASGVSVAQRPDVFVEISFFPLMTSDDGSFVGRLVELAGGNNLGENLPKPYSTVSPEAVLSMDPEVLLLLGEDCSRADVMQRLGWEGMRAIKAGAVYEHVDPDLVVRPGPRAVQGWSELVRLFHPELGDPFRGPAQDCGNE